MKYQKNLKTASARDFSQFAHQFARQFGFDASQVISCRAEVEEGFDSLTLEEGGDDNPSYVMKDGLRWKLDRGLGKKPFPKKEGGCGQQHVFNFSFAGAAGGKKVDAERVVAFLDDLRKEDQGTPSAPRTVSNCSRGLKSDVCTELINKLSKDPDCYNGFLYEMEPLLQSWVQKSEERAHVLVAE